MARQAASPAAAPQRNRTSPSPQCVAENPGCHWKYHLSILVQCGSPDFVTSCGQAVDFVAGLVSLFFSTFHRRCFFCLMRHFGARFSPHPCQTFEIPCLHPCSMIGLEDKLCHFILSSLLWRPELAQVSAPAVLTPAMHEASGGGGAVESSERISPSHTPGHEVCGTIRVEDS